MFFHKMSYSRGANRTSASPHSPLLGYLFCLSCSHTHTHTDECTSPPLQVALGKPALPCASPAVISLPPSPLSHSLSCFPVNVHSLRYYVLFLYLRQSLSSDLKSYARPPSYTYPFPIACAFSFQTPPPLFLNSSFRHKFFFALLHLFYFFPHPTPFVSLPLFFIFLRLLPTHSSSSQMQSRKNV